MCSLAVIGTCAAIMAFMASELYAAEAEVNGSSLPELLLSSAKVRGSYLGVGDSVPAVDIQTSPDPGYESPPQSDQGPEQGLVPQPSPAPEPSAPPAGAAPLTPQVSQVAKLSRFQRAKCHPLSFPDILDINKCLNGSASLCVKSRAEFRASLRKIALCCVKSVATANFAQVVLRVLRDCFILGARIVFPMTTGRLIPLLVKMRKKFRKEEYQATIIFTSRPCNETVDVYFPDFLGVADCIRPENFMCTKTGDIDLLPTQALTSLLLTAVCILKKLPFFKPLTIVWQLICSAFEMLHVTFGKTPNSFFYAVAEMGQLVFQCQIENILPSAAKTGHLRDLKMFS